MELLREEGGGNGGMLCHTCVWGGISLVTIFYFYASYDVAIWALNMGRLLKRYDVTGLKLMLF